MSPSHTQETDRTARPLDAGASLAPGYWVITHLGRGGVADIYDAWSQERHCRCIAKIVRPDHADKPGARRRVLREGRRLRQLAHPHLVRVYEVIEHPRPVVILETLTGATLEYLIEHHHRRLDLSDVARLGLHLCSAIQYLHGRGLLHLDLKPSNIICTGGLAKVLDLDIARPPGRSRGEGTRHYMAPEQVREDLLNTAADVWGIGSVLFEAATGRLPFDFDSRLKYPQLEQRATSIRALRRVPASVAQAIDSALAPEPRQRPTPHELYALLAPLAEPNITAHWPNGSVPRPM